MRELIRPLGLAALVALAGPAFGQDTAAGTAAETPAEGSQTAPAPEADAAPAEQQPAAQAEAPQLPEPYVKETFQDWRVICLKLPDGEESCNLQQLLKDANDNPVAQVSLAPLPPAAAPRAAGVEIATPLQTLLSEDLKLAIDTSAATVYRFTFCSPQACHARFALSADEIKAFKAGKAAKVTIVPLAAPDQTVDLTMSLAGFTAAYDKVAELNAQ